jgi:hypothetical protein
MSSGFKMRFFSLFFSKTSKKFSFTDTENLLPPHTYSYSPCDSLNYFFYLYITFPFNSTSVRNYPGPGNEVSRNEVSRNEVSRNEVSRNEVSRNEVSRNEVLRNEVPGIGFFSYIFARNAGNTTRSCA